MSANEGRPQHRFKGWGPPLLLCLVALALGFARTADATWAAELDRWLRLGDAPTGQARHVEGLLLVPLGSLIVVFVRLSLGLRMLGPFRPILIAIGFQGAGFWFGLAVFVGISVAIVLLRPALEGGWLPYFGRLSTLLAVVVTLVVGVAVVGNATGSAILSRATYVPIVVLCLAGDGFARALSETGLRAALFRGGTTLATAMLVHAVSELPGLGEALLDHPELLLVEVAGILLVSQYGRLGLLAWLNPRASSSGAVTEA